VSFCFGRGWQEKHRVVRKEIKKPRQAFSIPAFEYEQDVGYHPQWSTAWRTQNIHPSQYKTSLRAPNRVSFCFGRGWQEKHRVVSKEAKASLHTPSY